MKANLQNRDRFRQMLDNGVSITDEIQDGARRLAEKMKRVHGGEWNVRINHDRCLVLIAREVSE